MKTFTKSIIGITTNNKGQNIAASISNDFSDSDFSKRKYAQIIKTQRYMHNTDQAQMSGSEVFAKKGIVLHKNDPIATISKNVFIGYTFKIFSILKLSMSDILLYCKSGDSI